MARHRFYASPSYARNISFPDHSTIGILNQTVALLSKFVTHTISFKTQIIGYSPNLSVVIDEKFKSAILRKICFEIYYMLVIASSYRLRLPSVRFSVTPRSSHCAFRKTLLRPPLQLRFGPACCFWFVRCRPSGL